MKDYQFCKDCIHVDIIAREYWCGHERYCSYDFVTGNREIRKCEEIRTDETCDFFEETIKHIPRRIALFYPTQVDHLILKNGISSAVKYLLKKTSIKSIDGREHLIEHGMTEEEAKAYVEKRVQWLIDDGVLKDSMGLVI
jgi:hypothetical protein